MTRFGLVIKVVVVVRPTGAASVVGHGKCGLSCFVLWVRQVWSVEFGTAKKFKKCQKRRDEGSKSLVAWVVDQGVLSSVSYSGNGGSAAEYCLVADLVLGCVTGRVHRASAGRRRWAD